MKLLRKTIANRKTDNGAPLYHYVYGNFSDSGCRLKMKEWFHFKQLKDNPLILYQTREEILEILEENETSAYL